MSYVVAFNRDRDFYQLPLALHEHELLAGLVTDIYYPDSVVLRALPKMASMIHRRTEGLPSRKVRWSPSAILWQTLGPRLGVPLEDIFCGVGTALSRTALKLAVREKAHLFLYSECALEAFSAPEASRMVKGLFAFHPHTSLIYEIMAEDFHKHPECAWSYAQERDTAVPENLSARLDGEWSRANFIVTASSFTKKSFIHAGCPESRIHVVPYGAGITGTAIQQEKKSEECCRFLFVGQGTQRKGLHHLIKAWNKIAPCDAELVVIAGVIDPGIAALAGHGITILPRQSRASLFKHYASAHIFAMPSLIEGFGLVYTEALANGAFVIGTPNTGLPDINLPPWAGKIVPTGSIDMLAEAIDDGIRRWRSGALDADRIRKFAHSLTWEAFRSKIAEVARFYHP